MYNKFEKQSSGKGIIMKIRKRSSLVRFYAGPEHPIDKTSAEYRFMKAVCEGNTPQVLSLFKEKKLFGNKKSSVDTPYGRFEGLMGIRQFTEGFTARFHASSAFMEAAVQTIANGRAALEFDVNFVINGEIEQVPMILVADFRTKDTLDEVRIYCYHTYVPGLQAYRRPLFQSAHLEMADPDLLTGAVREYYAALHHSPAVDVERILKCIHPNCKLGAYAPHEGERDNGGSEDLRAFYEGAASYIPRCVAMRYETITDNGKTCVLEWVHVISKAGQEEHNRIAISGIAAYERGDNGLLCGIRICDYAGYESTIDWNQLTLTKEEAQQINYVDTFPSGCGRKKQENLL